MNNPKQPSNLWRHLLIGLCMVAVTAAGWYYVSHSPEPDKPGSWRRGQWDQPAVVRAEPAIRGSLDVQIQSIGTVTPLNTVTVRSRVDGLLDKIVFEEGATVEAGDLLAEIDPLPYQAQLEQAQGQLQQNRARLENARSDLKLYEQLWEQDSIARQQLSDQRALVKELAGTIRANEAQVEDARLQLSWTQIKAPIGGRLGLRRVDPGNLVSSADSEGLVSITQMQPITVNFTVSEVQVPDLLTAFRSGQPLQVDAMNRDAQKRLAQGTLTTLDNQIDTATGTLKVRARFSNEDNALFPNQFVNVRLRLNTLQDVVTISADAVQYGVDNTYVYMVQEGKAYVRNVTLGPISDNRIAVESGLQAGDQVVLEGLDRLRDGREVVTQDELTPAPDKTAVGETSEAPGA